jgi:hypothetical protein
MGTVMTLPDTRQELQPMHAATNISQFQLN